MSSTYISRFERERKEKEKRTWQDKQRKLQSEIDSINSQFERSRLQKALNIFEKDYLQAMNNGRESAAKSLVDDLKRKILSTQADDKMLASVRGEFVKLTSSLEHNAPKYFLDELHAITSRDIDTVSIEQQIKNIKTLTRQAQDLATSKKILDSMRDDFMRLISALEANSPEYFHDELNKILAGDIDSCSIAHQIQKLRTLTSQAHDLAKIIEQVNDISIEGLTEEKIYIPALSASDDTSDDISVQVLQDIFDFFGRTEFYDSLEAAKLRPLVREAEKGTALSRLKLIRTQIKVTYNRLREQRILTDMFKSELRDFLPPLKQSTEPESVRVCKIIEDMMTANVISRDEYERVCRDAESILDRQADESFIQEIAGTLNEMGYTLLDENGSTVELAPDKMFMLDTPYNGYRVRIKASHDNKLVTRLIRVAGSEEEKSSSSEYQKQKDIETGKKWCSDLKKFYSALEGKGFLMHDIMRKEPGEEALDIIVDESFKNQQKTSQAENLQLQERKL